MVAAVEAALACRLDTLTPSRIQAEVQRLALRLQPETAAGQEASATADRTASRRALPHGQSEIVLTGPAAANQRWWQALTDHARALKAAGDPRSLGALRYDLALSLDPRHSPGTDPLLQALGAGHPGGQPDAAPPSPTTPDQAGHTTGTDANSNDSGDGEGDGVGKDSDDCAAAPPDPPVADPPGSAPDRPAPFGFGPPLTDDRRCTRPVQAQITVPASTALGLDDEPGWLAGHGWISAPLSRQLLTLAELRKACLHPRTGQLIDQADQLMRPERTPTALRDTVRTMILTAHDLRPLVTDPQPQHDPSPALQYFIQARDRYCDGPTGTAVPASHTDTDHHHPWPIGPTAAWNLHSRSPRTHHLKHYGWRAVRTTDGTRWTSPAGQTVLNPHGHHPPPRIDPDTGPPDPQEQAARDRALTRPPLLPTPPDDPADTDHLAACSETDVEVEVEAAPTPHTINGWPADPAF